MQKDRYHIRPSIIWICVLLVLFLLAVVLNLTVFTKFTDEQLQARGAKTGYGREQLVPVWIVISLLLLLFEVKFITVSEDQILVYNILGIRRRLTKEKIKQLQFVRKQETYYFLIILKDHEAYGGYKKDVLSFAYFSPIKVIHIVISSKKWKNYFEEVKKYYPNTSFLDCDS